MRLLATMTCAVLLVVGVVGATQAQQGPSRISVTATVAAVGGGAIVYRIWNRSVSGVPIGNMVVACSQHGAGGVFGRGIASCTATLSLPLGKITAAGVRHSRLFYSLVITGGTGRYTGAVGSLHRRPDRPREVRFILFLG
jgi:hypothetical protein